MAYSQGDKILNDHYNTFISGGPTGIDHAVPNVNSIWGVGRKDKGYGQGTELTTVTAGDTITAVQWAAMLARMTAMASHQATRLAPINAPTNGDLIEALAPISANITNLDTNRLEAVGSGSSANITASASASWALSSVHTIQVQFRSADAARYFFNAGGHIDLSFSRTGGSVHTKNADWTNLLADSGIIRLTGYGAKKIGGSGSYGSGSTDIIYNNGYFNWVNGGGSRVFRQFASGSVYTSNSIDVFAVTEGQQGPNGDNGGLFTFIVTLNDSAGGPSVNGTTSVNCLVRYPSRTFLTQTSWGVVTFPVNSVVQS